MLRHIRDIKRSAADNAAYAETLKNEGARLVALRAAMTDRLRELAANLTEVQKSINSANQAMQEFQQYAREINVQNE